MADSTMGPPAVPMVVIAACDEIKMIDGAMFDYATYPVIAITGSRFDDPELAPSSTL